MNLPGWEKFAWISVNQALKEDAQISRMIAPFLGGDDTLFGKRTNQKLEDFFDLQKLKSIQPDKTADISVLIGVGAAIPEYFQQQCGKSMIALGDWSAIDGLRSYSGGAIYRKSIFLNQDEIKSRLVIDLGYLVSSAELTVNGKSAGIKLSPPWNFDISNLVKSGENTIEIIVYNTLPIIILQFQPDTERKIVSGLIGPVLINSYK
jgi:hypothetical protein